MTSAARTALRRQHPGSERKEEKRDEVMSLFSSFLDGSLQQVWVKRLRSRTGPPLPPARASRVSFQAVITSTGTRDSCASAWSLSQNFEPAQARQHEVEDSPRRARARVRARVPRGRRLPPRTDSRRRATPARARGDAGSSSSVSESSCGFPRVGQVPGSDIGSKYGAALQGHRFGPTRHNDSATPVEGESAWSWRRPAGAAIIA